MKHKPQSLTRRSAALVLAISAATSLCCQISPIFARAQDDDTAGSGNGQSSATDKDEKSASASPLTPSDKSAKEVFAAVAETLDNAMGLSCDIRQMISMSGLKFVADGKYAQASGNRFRLEYQIQPIRSVRNSDKNTVDDPLQPVGDSKTATGSLLQVSDGSVLWSHWKNGDKQEASRRNIAEILKAVEDIPNYSTASSLQDLGVGGLQTLMSKLQTGMDFGAVQERTVAGKTLLVLSGRWSRKSLTEIFKVPEDVKDPIMQGYLPDYVRIYVDTASNLPRRIQYLKRHPDPEQAKVRPLVTLDFRNLNLNPPFGESAFEIPRLTDDDITEADLTSDVIDNIKRLAAADSGDEGADDKTTDEAPDADSSGKDE